MDKAQYWTYYRSPGKRYQEIYITPVGEHKDRESAKRFLAEFIGCSPEDIEIYGGADCLSEQSA